MPQANKPAKSPRKPKVPRHPLPANPEPSGLDRWQESLFRNLQKEGYTPKEAIRLVRRIA